MERFNCPYLDVQVECTEERIRHIQERHPELAGELWPNVADVLLDPDTVRARSGVAGAYILSRWYDETNKHIVAVVISEPSGRHWLITASVARRLSGGEPQWQRN